jgi:anion-transporting  ArsA/GET3 family ATPase
MQIIEGRALQVFLRPTGFAGKIFGRGASMGLSVLTRITGVDLLRDLSEFFQAFSGMVGGFRERAKRVNELLSSRETSFLVVCGPQGEPISEAVYFHRKLVEAEMPFGGVIVNRVHYDEALATPADRIAEELEETLPGQLAERVAANYSDWRTLAERDRRNVDHLAREMRTRAVIEVPELDSDVHDLAGLMSINRYLFASGAEERTELAAGGGSL